MNKLKNSKMNKSIFSAFLIGAISLASLSMFVACKDYDDDINDLKQQITSNAKTLTDLVEEKCKNCTALVEALGTQLDDLEKAYQMADLNLETKIVDATNDAKGYADIQAAEAEKAAIKAAETLVKGAMDELSNAIDETNKRIDGNDKSIADLLAADNILTTAVQTAQTRADKAYELAEKVEKLANENKEVIAGVAANLKTISESLQSQIDTLGENLNEVKKTADKAAADIEAQQAALIQLKEDNDKALTALSEKDDELLKLIQNNQQDIQDLFTKVQEAKDAAKQALEDAKKYTDEELEKATKTLKDYADQVGKDANTYTDVEIKKIKDAYELADKELQDQINALKGRVETLEGQVEKLQKELEKVNAFLNILQENLNNLVTGIIVQDQDVDIVYGKIVPAAEIDQTGLQLTVAKDGAIWFPYVGATDAKDELVSGKYLVRPFGGRVVYTVNPNSINFDGQVTPGIENSKQEDPKGVSLSVAKYYTKDQPTIKHAPAVAGVQDNGLYYSTITNASGSKSDLWNEAPAFDNDYALYTSYNQTIVNEDGTTETVTKRVYSKYEVKLATAEAEAETTPAIIPIKNNDGVVPTRATEYGDYVYTYTDTEDKEMTARFELDPENTVYRKYVEVVDVKNGQYETVPAADLKNKIKLFADANKEVLYKTYQINSENNFDGLTDNTDLDVVVPQEFIGTFVTFRYYIQNYNGTIYSQDVEVQFVKTVIPESTVTIEHSPTAAGDNVTATNDFEKEANIVADAKWNKVWTNDAVTLQLDVVSGTFKSAELTSAGIVFDLTQGTDSKSEFTKTDLEKVKNIKLTYDPADLELDKTYKLKLTSYDKTGNVVSVTWIEFTMLYEPLCHNLINPNPAYFTPYDFNMTEADLKKGVAEVKTYTAWAKYEEGMAVYNMIVGFNAPRWATDGCVLRFQPANTQGENDLSTFPWVTDASAPVLNDYNVVAPLTSLIYGKEVVYPIDLGVEKYGVASLWKDTHAFNLIFKSRLAWADTKFDDKKEVGYPDKTITLTDADIWSDDPSTSKVQDEITYFGAGRDIDIKSDKVELVDKQFASLFKSFEVTDYGIVITTNEAELGGVGSITQETIHFVYVINDVFGNVIEHPFQVKVFANK